MAYTEQQAHKINRVQLLAALAVGIVTCFLPLTVTVLWVAVIVTTIVSGIYNKPEHIWYGVAASPMLEVWSRMVKGAVMVDEIGKYYLLLCIVLLTIHHVKEHTAQPMYKTGGVIIVLLIPGLFVNIPGFDLGQWVFNILPTLELALLLMLAARERWDVERFAKTLHFAIMAVIPAILYLLIKTPSLSDVNFMLGANFSAGGGATNQVATVLGLGILLIVLSLLLKRPPMLKWLCYLLLGVLLFRSFLTFSRGGVFSAAASVAIAIGFAMVVNRKTFIRYSLVLITIALIGILAFDKVDDITGNKLSLRYSGETMATLSGEQEKTWNKITSGRTNLIAADWVIFMQYPLFGVGPGGAKEFRNNLGAHKDSAAHTEFTRLLSEHGLGGMLVAGLLILFPIYWLRRQKHNLWRGVSAALFCMAILTASHSAMRTNTTIVCYVLAAMPVLVRTNKLEATPRRHIVHRQ